MNGPAVPFSGRVLVGSGTPTGEGLLIDLLTGDTITVPKGGVLALKVFGGDLYIGTGGDYGGKIYKTTDLSSFSEQFSSDYHVNCLNEFNDNLWAGVGSNLYSSPDGSTWTDQGAFGTPQALLNFGTELIISTQGNTVWMYDGDSFYKFATLGTAGWSITEPKHVAERAFFTTGHCGAVWTLEKKSYILHPIAFPTLSPYTVTVYNGRLWIGGGKETYIKEGTYSSKASVLEVSELHPYHKVHGNFHSFWTQRPTDWTSGFPLHAHYYDTVTLYMNNTEDVDVDYQVYTRHWLSGGDAKAVITSGTLSSGAADALNISAKGVLGVDAKSASSPTSGKFYAHWMV